MRNLDIDAFPDTTPVQVQINTIAPSLGPAEVEQQITYPIEQSLTGLPKVNTMRSISKFGLSQVVIIFEDGTDIYFARQLVNERISNVQLPHGLDRPKMGPVSTGLGEVYHYVITGKGDDVTQLRTVHDWIVRPANAEGEGRGRSQLLGRFRAAIPGSHRPVEAGEVWLHLRSGDNGNVQGEQPERRRRGDRPGGSNTLLVHGLGRTTTLEQIRLIPLAVKDGIPTLLGDVAEVTIGHEVRRGAVTADGLGEVVLGLGFMTMGENSHEVTWGLKHKFDEVKATLPAGVKVIPVYDRTELVDYVIASVRANLFEGGLFVVIAILFLFLGNLRAAFIVALAIPLSMLFAFTGMWRFGIAASLLSLGAIDFGMVVDSSVVMIENCVRHLASGPPERQEPARSRSATRRSRSASRRSSAN